MSIAAEAAAAVKAFDAGTLFDGDAGKNEVYQGAQKLRDLLDSLVDAIVARNPELADEVDAARGCLVRGNAYCCPRVTRV